MVLVCEEIEAPLAVAGRTGVGAADHASARAHSPGLRAKGSGSSDGGNNGDSGGAGACDRSTSEHDQLERREQYEVHEAPAGDQQPGAPPSERARLQEWANWQAEDLAGAAGHGGGALLRGESPSPRVEEPVAAPASPHKRQLSLGPGTGAEQQDPAAKRAAASLEVGFERAPPDGSHKRRAPLATGPAVAGCIHDAFASRLPGSPRDTAKA